ncbi:hypothetical protein AC249_AIPGENE9421 [Exaiptasia diaphana]|nr:hypothetical protein AC249_AIPGENE9421 [Exaiptasia diaphana]
MEHKGLSNIFDNFTTSVQTFQSKNDQTKNIKRGIRLHAEEIQKDSLDRFLRYDVRHLYPSDGQTSTKTTL